MIPWLIANFPLFCALLCIACLLAFMVLALFVAPEGTEDSAGWHRKTPPDSPCTGDPKTCGLKFCAAYLRCKNK